MLDTMKHNSNGFDILTCLLVIVVGSIAGFVGWRIYAQQSPSNSKSAEKAQPSMSMVSITDSSKTFSYNYPSNWSIQKFTYNTCCEGPVQPEPDWSKQPQPMTLKEKTASLDAAISIKGDTTGFRSIEDTLSNGNKDRFNSVARLYDYYQVSKILMMTGSIVSD